MSFSKQYAALEVKFKEQVKKDNEDFGLKSRFLANIAPKGPVDYVLIAMEPSLPANIDDIRNFTVSVEDFILHFCVNEYLCKGAHAYHLTDLSKGAMLTSQAQVSRQCRYERWYSLLCEELELVAQPGTAVIAIGTAVERFLMKQQFPSQLAGRILHYSWSASRYRQKMAERFPEQFAEFKAMVNLECIIATAERVLNEAGLGPCVRKETVKRLRAGTGLTESRKQLMFSYKCEFEKILQSTGR